MHKKKQKQKQIGILVKNYNRDLELNWQRKILQQEKKMKTKSMSIVKNDDNFFCFGVKMFSVYKKTTTTNKWFYIEEHNS